MKLYACGFLVVASIFNTIFCSDDPYVELPPVLKEICKKSRPGDDSSDNSDCRHLAILMKPCDLKTAQAARKVAMGMSCYETTQGWVSEEEQEALKFLGFTKRWAEAAQDRIQKLGKKHRLSEKAINEATVYCQDKIQGKMVQSKTVQVGEPLPTEPASCPGCALENKSFWQFLGYKKQ